jgi:hypothetical protein
VALFAFGGLVATIVLQTVASALRAWRSSSVVGKNPMLMLRAPDVSADAKDIYTGKQFNDLLIAASESPDNTCCRSSR